MYLRYGKLMVSYLIASRIPPGQGGSRKGLQRFGVTSLGRRKDRREQVGSGGWERSGSERRSEKIEETGTDREEMGEQRDSREARVFLEGSSPRGTNPF